jgi:dienelactone hydrolase
MLNGRTIPALFSLLAAVSGLFAQKPVPGLNGVTLRGRLQNVYLLPAAGTAGRAAGTVLYLPGDGGWRGFAVEIAKSIASFGYDVYAWDTKQYLESFTDRRGALKEGDVAEDFRFVAQWASQEQRDRVIACGWSEGAGLALLAAASPDNKSVIRGLLAIGLPEYGALGWRLADNLTYLTKKVPNEPQFSSLPQMPKVAPLPLAMIYSTRDEYVAQQRARQLHDAASPPKRMFLVEARDHRFAGNQADFFKALREALAWIQTTP